MNAMMPQAPKPATSSDHFVRAVIEIAKSPEEFKQRLDDMEAKRVALAAQADASIAAALKADASTNAANAKLAEVETKLKELDDYGAATKAELARAKAKTEDEASKREALLIERERVANAKEASLQAWAKRLDETQARVTADHGVAKARTEDLNQREAAVTEREQKLAQAKAEHEAKVKAASAAIAALR